MEPLPYEKRGYLNEPFRLFHLADDRHEEIAYHYHSFHKIIMLLAGRAGYAIEGERYTLQPGDYVLVAGAGVMAQLTAQVVMANGGNVIMTGLASDEERFALAKSLGVFATVRVDEGDPLSRVLQLTGGMGVDKAFECSGAAASADFCLDALKKTGYYTQIAIPGKPIPFDMDKALYKEITISNSYASERSSWLTALRLLEHRQIHIDSMISDMLPLSEWQDGFERTIAKREFKILLTPNAVDHPDFLKAGGQA